MIKLDGKTTIITGGASGIGAATARLFVEAGAYVLIADIQDTKGDLLAKGLGSRAAYLHADVSKEEDVKRAIDHVVTHCGHLDCMLNNAGIPGNIAESVESITANDFDTIIGVLLRGVFFGIKHAAMVMRKQGCGNIINTASVAGLRAGYAGHVYSAAKAAVIQLTRSVAMELGEKGIRVNCICPGGIATPIYGRALGLSAEAADQSVEIMQAALANMQPIRRAGSPEDVARAALWLASDYSGFVNGHALVVDGGLIGGQAWSALQQMIEKMRLWM